MEQRGKDAPESPRKILLIWGLVSVLGILPTPAVGQTALTELMETLNLSEYPRGWQAPPISGQTSASGKISLASLRGRVVLVNFWASWCPPCRAEMGQFEQLHRDFTEQGLTVLGINVQEQAQVIQRFGEKLGLTFPLLLDTQGKITKAYGVIGLPSTFLIGRDGRPVALAVGPRDWGTMQARALIQALLAEPVARGSTTSDSLVSDGPARRQG